MNDSFIIAVDLGGTSFRVALADSAATFLNRNAEPTRASDGPRIGMQRIIETIRTTASTVGMEKIKGIAVATAGPIDPGNGVILTPPSLPSWHNVPLKQHLKEAFHIPVWVESDADMAAVGEHRFGAGQGYDRLVYFTVSTGIGGGIIIDGQLLRGSKISAAEIGHIIVDPRGPQCNCGGKGHVEAMASGTAIARMAKERISHGSASSLVELCQNDLSRLTAEMVVAAARKGDNLASEVVHEAGTSLGIAVVSLMHTPDPDIVIIGGGVSNAGDLILQPIREVIADRAMIDFRNRTKVVQSALGDDSGLYGAIAFGLDKLG
ncbi:MAG: ROK family protein [Chloroflexi bacterium]|nr:ROK family protein [Chloroflexota bacterium]